jgi:hypothetical protein
MITHLLEGIHGGMLYGYEGQLKTKEKVIQSYWWKKWIKILMNSLKNMANARKQKIET